MNSSRIAAAAANIPLKYSSLAPISNPARKKSLAKAFLPSNLARALPRAAQPNQSRLKMLRFSSAAASFRPANPAAQGGMASQQQQSFLQPNAAAQGMCRLSAATALQPADPAGRGGLASQQQKISRIREFDHFIVIDFEATCERDARIYPQEIIEFPAVLVDAATGDLLSSFRTYVKPRHHPRLTNFCSELTGIQQEQVDGGVDLATALAMHDTWLVSAGAAKNRLAVVTWGDWDCKTMLESECTFKNLDKPSYFNKGVNLRIPFEAAFGAGRRNLQEAVREAGLQWDGRLHCGLDDARNTTRLLAELMRRGVSISITGSLRQPPPPPPEPESEPELQFLPQMTPVNHNLSWPAPELQLQAQMVPVNKFSLCTGGVATTGCSCYCGLPIRGNLVTAPGPMQGRFFFTCGNWTPSLGPMCSFFHWAA